MTAAWILSFGLYIFWGTWIEQIYTYVFFNNVGFSVGLGMPILIILTSDAVKEVSAKHPKDLLILRTGRSQKGIAWLYGVLMMMLFGAVTLWHIGPKQAEWMMPFSAVAAALLICLSV